MRIDHFNRVIFHLLGQADFSGAEIVIADVGVSMMKGTRACRAQLPEWVVTVAACRTWAGHCLFIELAQARSARRAQCPRL